MTIRLAALAAATLLAGAVAASAQPTTGASPGVPGDQAVDPAPGATQPYLGHPQAFYDPMQRLQALDSRAATLPPGQARSVRADLRRAHAFAETQKARHGGELRDWDRERLTQLLDEVTAKHPQLRE